MLVRAMFGRSARWRRKGVHLRLRRYPGESPAKLFQEFAHLAICSNLHLSGSFGTRGLFYWTSVLRSKIILIDGATLAKLMIDFGVGGVDAGNKIAEKL